MVLSLALLMRTEPWIEVRITGPDQKVALTQPLSDRKYLPFTWSQDYSITTKSASYCSLSSLVSAVNVLRDSLA